MVDHIFNGEQGLKVREKLNEVIDRTNDLMGVENHGQQGGNPHRTKASQVTQANTALGANVQTALDKLDQRQSSDNSNNSSHANNKNNPHEVKAEQVQQSNAELGDDVQEALNDLHGSVVELVEMLPEKADLDHIDGLNTHIQLRRGTNPLEAWSDDLMVAELFFHYTKGQLWSKLNDGTSVLIGSPSFIEDAPRDGYTYGRNDGQWARVGATEVGDDRPENPVTGTLWYDTGHTCELYVYDGNQWVSMTGGNGGWGEIEEIPDNIVLDDAPGLLQNVALAREIDSNGDGVWRQITTSDLVTENNQPMFRDSGGRFTTSDEGVIRNQQQANWYLRDRITEGVEKQDELENKIKALEGAVGEHSLLFTIDEASGPQFFITNGMGKQNRLSEASFITLPEVDRSGNTIALDRISQGDVLRMGDGFGEFAELRINGDPEGNTFPYNQIGGDMDRLTDSIPYDFTVFVAFDPAGLATTDYVDAQDELRVKKTGSTMSGSLKTPLLRSIKVDSGENSNLNLLRNGESKVVVSSNQVKFSDPIKLSNMGDDPSYAATKKYVDDRVAEAVAEALSRHTPKFAPLWKYTGTHVSDNDPMENGTFKLLIDGSKVVLYIAELNANGQSWYVDNSNNPYGYNESGELCSVTDKNGSAVIMGCAKSYEFEMGSHADSKHAKVTLTDSKVRGSGPGVYFEENYYINISGLLPAAPYDNYYRTHPTPDPATRAVTQESPENE